MQVLLKKFLAGMTIALLVAWMLPCVYAPELPREDTLFVTGAQWTPPSTWNLLAPSQTWGTYLFGGFMYLPLFQYSCGLDAWVPIIGERVEWVNNYTLRIHIRSEAKWSDGQPITAYDVEYTYKLSYELGSGPAAGSEPYITDVKAIDDKTVEFVMNNETRNYFMFSLYALQMAPGPKHIIRYVYEQLGNSIIEWRNGGGLCDDLIDVPQVVSGPYRLYYFDELRVAYERIDDWWGKEIFGLPKPKYLVHRIYLSNEQILLDLMQGNVDWAGIFIPEVQTLNVGTWYKDKPYFRPNQILVLYINQQVKALRDASLKRAMAYAIDYEKVIERAEYGYTKQASMSFVFEIYPHFKAWINTTLAQEYWGNPYAKVQTNKDLAKQVLAQAGYEDRDGDSFVEPPSGEKLEVTVIVPSGWTDWMIAADLIAEDLRAVGINAESRPVDYGAFWGYIQGGNYTLALGWVPTPTFSHPWDTYRSFLDPRLTPPMGNWEWYNNTDIMPILEQAAQVFTYEEKMKYFSKVQEIIYEEIPSIALMYTPQWYEYSEKYWIGWPNEDYPWWTEVAPYREYSTPLWLLFGLAKKGEPVEQPGWAKTVEKGGILIPGSQVISIGNVTQVEIPSNATDTTPPDENETSPQPASALYRFLIGLMLIVAVVLLVLVVIRIKLKKK